MRGIHELGINQSEIEHEEDLITRQLMQELLDFENRKDCLYVAREEYASLVAYIS
jgi:uncharacterized protein Yka (UPF0111/DUF47 family)